MSTSHHMSESPHMSQSLTGRVDEVTYRILAPNPSPMTLDGTNTYLLGEAGAGEVVVVDPGPDIPAHRKAIEDAVHLADAEIVAVVVTHHHTDHAEAAPWSTGWQAPLYAHQPGLVPGATPFTDGAKIERAGVVLEAIHTPGHASDHLCVRVAGTGVVLAGDHVLGRGTSVVSWPDGDLRAYLQSLERLATVKATRLDPGHGPSLHDPARAIAAYLEHRRERDRQIVAALRSGAASPAQIVARVYADVDPVLHPAAERSVRAHLVKMADDGRVAVEDRLADADPRVQLLDGAENTDV